MISFRQLLEKLYVEEEMTASSGAISGMGYNIGGPPPDDVAVSKEAQASYTSGNMQKSSPILSEPFRRKITKRYKR
jgi:hypothetical protein